MTTAAPGRSLEQRRSALKTANEIRAYRKWRKRDLKASRITFHDLIGDPLCDTMKVWDGLIAMPKFGRVKVNRLLLQCRISPSKTIAGLSERQQSELLTELGARRDLRLA